MNSADIRFGATDLTNCDREPIHIPGSIQSHGVLLVLDRQTLVVEQLAGDTRFLLGLDPARLSDVSISRILDAESVAFLNHQLESTTEFIPPAVHLGVRAHSSSLLLDLTMHAIGGTVIVELEPARRTSSLFANPLGQFKTLLSQLHRNSRLDDLCESAATGVRQLCGFARVMVYRFLEDDTGLVVAESVAAGVESYLGLHYPASDIPRQARELYRRTWLRGTPDIDCVAAPLAPELNPRTRLPLDMTHCVLRSMSPIHVEYLRNMGVCASVSVSIMLQDRLWGLIALHDFVPHHVPADLRIALESFAQVFSLLVEAKIQAENTERRTRARQVRAHLVAPLLDGAVPGTALATNELLDYVGATGAALIFEGKVTTVGQAPAATQIEALAKWLSVGRKPVQATDHLCDQYPEASGFADVASGLLAISLSNEPCDFVLWFRPELVRTVRWGGNPAKPVNFGPMGARLTPRSSFAEWCEELRNRSEPWTAIDLESAVELRSALLESALRSSAAQIRTMFEAMAEGFVLQLQDGAIVNANPAAESILGLSRDQLLGRTSLDADWQAVLEDGTPFPGADHPAMLSLKSGKSIRDQIMGVRNSKMGLRWLSVNSQPIFSGGNPVPTAVVVTFSDITERRTAEMALRASESLLARTGAIAGVGGWEFDISERALTWSDQTKRIYEVDPSYQPTVQAALSFFKPDSIAVVQKHFEACIDTAEPFDLELELVTAKGRTIWTRYTGAAESEMGKVVRLVGAIQDITRRKKLERELAEGYELLRVTLESIGDAVVTTDPTGHVMWLNPAAERLTGWSKGEARSRPLRDVFNISTAESHAPSLDPVAVCLNEGKLVGLQSSTALISRHGTEYGIEDSASPIRNAEGDVLGAVLVFHDVSEQRRLSQEMSHRATHDALTGLVNREEFEHRLSRLLEDPNLNGNSHVLMYIDLDEFKVVNDACGHAAGDQLLRQVSVLLKGATRSRDTVARLGGDEFGVILEMCNIEHGREIGQKICDQMELYRFDHGGRRYRIGTSIGIVPVDLRWESSAAVLQAADSCCYAAKDAGRNRVHVWIESDKALLTRHGQMQWVTRLEAAIDENRFVLFAQHIEPIQGPAAGLHCEVLLRLREDDGSIILPDSFLPAAERFHLMSRIDKWVLQKVFSMLEADAIARDRIGTIAVNISGQSIGDRAFHRSLIAMLREARFDTHKLCFEITETVAITNLVDAKSFIDEVRSLGVRIALDDFGAGASSFGYLRMLPVDYLKIDGEFVTGLLEDPIKNAAVRCFCEVAKVVGVKTIAEFVERSDIRDALKALGVDMAQGYLIHRPEPLTVLLPGPPPQTSVQQLALVKASALSN